MAASLTSSLLHLPSSTEAQGRRAQRAIDGIGHKEPSNPLCRPRIKPRLDARRQLPIKMKPCRIQHRAPVHSWHSQHCNRRRFCHRRPTQPLRRETSSKAHRPSCLLQLPPCEALPNWGYSSETPFMLDRRGDMGLRRRPELEAAVMRARERAALPDTESW